MRTAALLLLAAIAAGADQRGQPRTAKRDEASSQRTVTPAPRSTAARREFQRQHPCPSTHKQTGPCPGYVIDHVIALKRGGLDKPDNMQWQTLKDAKAKDRIE